MQRPLRMTTPSEVRRSIVKICNEVRAGTISPAQGNCIICGANTVLSSLRIDEQKRLIETLEARLIELEENH